MLERPEVTGQQEPQEIKKKRTLKKMMEKMKAGILVKKGFAVMVFPLPSIFLEWLVT